MVSRVSRKDWRVDLEEELGTRSIRIKTYPEWEHNRKEDWKNLLIKCRPDLTKSMSNEEAFYNELLSHRVFNKRTIESIKVELAFFCFDEVAKLDLPC
jgi:hypothetical protein